MRNTSKQASEQAGRQAGRKGRQGRQSRSFNPATVRVIIEFIIILFLSLSPPFYFHGLSLCQQLQLALIKTILRTYVRTSYVHMTGQQSILRAAFLSCGAVVQYSCLTESSWTFFFFLSFRTSETTVRNFKGPFPARKAARSLASHDPYLSVFKRLGLSIKAFELGAEKIQQPEFRETKYIPFRLSAACYDSCLVLALAIYWQQTRSTSQTILERE